MKWIVLIIGIIFLTACSSPTKKKSPEKAKIKVKYKKSETEHRASNLKEPEDQRLDLDSVMRVSKPKFGYRFQIEGDFDGDGKKELLTEHYVSQITGKEINKYFDGIDEYGIEVELTTYRKPFSLVSSTNPLIKDLEISKEPQLLGLKLLKNEGDLDGDGGDELSYIISWADWSSVNYWYIMSYKKGKWENLYSFEIRDWQIPYLPGYDDGELFLKTNKVVIPLEDTMNIRMERELLGFKGLVKKIGNRKIEVEYVNFESEETKRIVTLKK